MRRLMIYLMEENEFWERHQRKRTRERRVSCDTHTHKCITLNGKKPQFYCWQVGPFKLQPNSI